MKLNTWNRYRVLFLQNLKYYLQEAAGLGIFMVSACLFGALLEGEGSIIKSYLPDGFLRLLIMAVLMGVTALFIFYSPFTAPSGSQINPAVTITFLRLKKISGFDAVFYIIAQVVGALITVVIMQWLMGPILTHPPVNSVVTVPMKHGVAAAACIELFVAFITMSVVLFSSNHKGWKNYTRIITASLVCLWVIVAGPVSGFGMNPARSLASAIPANIWTAFWIYIVMPLAGMILAAEFFLYVQRTRRNSFRHKKVTRRRVMEPSEFVL